MTAVDFPQIILQKMDHNPVPNWLSAKELELW